MQESTRVVCWRARRKLTYLRISEFTLTQLKVLFTELQCTWNGYFWTWTIAYFSERVGLLPRACNLSDAWINNINRSTIPNGNPLQFYIKWNHTVIRNCERLSMRKSFTIMFENYLSTQQCLILYKPRDLRKLVLEFRCSFLTRTGY